MSALADVIDAYAALKVAAACLAKVEPGEQIEADIPDITLSYRVNGKQIRGRIVSVTVEREG
ncbi:MAG: hypothetical protein NT029_08200 [Armatimonadetes bacterium]|nr:hypothetical protein [Armatimonadota bacterium]